MNRDNRQEIGLAAWLAGIIDGEGTISLTISNRADRFRSQTIRTSPKVVIGNTDAGIIEGCVEALRVIGVGHYQRHERRPGGLVAGTMVKKFKPVTMIEISGFLRVRKLLHATREWLRGEKAQRAKLLLKFIEARIGRAEATRSAQNLSYSKEDVAHALAFLAVTRTKNIDHITKILNEHTRETRQDARRDKKRDHNRENRDLQNRQRRERRHRSRCALDLQETARAGRNDQPPPL